MRKFLIGLVMLMSLGLMSPGTFGAWAGPHPSPVDKLFSQLKAAETAQDAKALENQILASFLASGSATVDLLMTRANAALAGGKKDVARHLYDVVTELAPRYAEGWHRRGLMQADAGDDAGAMVSLQKTVDLNGRHFEAMNQLAGMLEDFGDKPGALALYRRALALDPQYEGLQRHIDALTRDVEGQGI